jgi:predicted ATPase/DNA-binding SARP family transcriptional activator
LKNEKTKALLKILVGERGKIFTPDELIECLWPDSDPAVAAGNLRARIAQLRRWLEPHLKDAGRSRFVLTRPQGYRFASTADCTVDAEEFVQLVQAGQASEASGQLIEAIQNYERALSLYRGDYLSEDRYEEWAAAPRTRYRELCLETLAHLADGHARLGQYRRAIARCRQILAQQPARESVYVQLMTYYYLAGDHAAALQAFEECEHAVARDLAIAVSPSVRELQKQILERHVPGIDEKYRPAPIPTQPVPYSLGQTPFVGRTRERGLLLRWLEEAQQGQGSVALLAGEAGVGKSRLAHEITALARTQHAIILQGRCQELTIQLPCQPLIQALRLALPELPPAVFSDVPLYWLAELAKLLPELPHFVGTDLTPAPALTPEQERLRLFEALTQFTLALARCGPMLVLLIDDLQWADSTSLDYLNFLVPRLASQPFLVLGTFRTEEVEPGRALVHPARDTPGRELVHRLELSRLDATEVAELLQALNPAVNPRLAERLYAETEGNPFFLISVIQALFEEGAIRIAPDRAWVTEIDDLTQTYQELLIPSQVREVLERRVRSLVEEERELLQLAAVAGHTVEYRVLQQAWVGPTEELPRVLEKLMERQLLRQRATNGTPLEFNHDKIRQYLYGSLSAPRRRLLHGRVGLGVERVHAGRLEDFYGILAHHFTLDEAPEKAFYYVLKTLDRATQLYQNDEALRLVERGLALAQLVAESDPRAAPQMRFELLQRRAELYHLTGQLAAQEKDIQEMRISAGTLQDPGAGAEAQWQLARFYLVTGRYPQALEAAQQGYDRLRSADSPEKTSPLVCKHLLNLGAIYFYMGDFPEALRYYAETLEEARRHHDVQREASATSAMALIYRQLGDHAGAMSRLEQGLELYRRLCDRHGESNALTHLANIHFLAGRLREALAQYAQAYAISAEIGDRRGQANALLNQGNAERQLGRYESALQRYHAAYQIRHELGDRHNQAGLLACLGTVFHALGQSTSAFDYYDRARRLWEELQSRAGRALIARNLGEWMAQQGDRESALAHYRQAYTLYEEVTNVVGYAECLHQMSWLHWERQELKEAAEACERSLALAKQIGSGELQIKNLSLRGLLALAQDQREEALSASQKALGLLTDETMLEQPHQIYFQHSRILEALGRHAEASAYLERAARMVQERAGQLQNLEFRASFLNHVPLNVEILRAWQARGDAANAQGA